MKELSIEEKAKAYDEALKIAKEAAEKGMVSHNFVSDIFPELKESEDERIRRQTLKVLNYYKDEEKSEGRMPTEIDECIAWLEKQGEQKFSDIDNKFLRMRETKPANILEFLERLTTVEQEFLWEHIEKVRKIDREERERKSAWSEKYIANVFEKVGLAKIVREQSNDNLTNALQDAMIELSKFIPQSNPAWNEEDKNMLKWVTGYLNNKMLNTSIAEERTACKNAIVWIEKQANHANFFNKIQIGDKVTRNKDGVLVNLSQLNRVAKPADKVEPKFKVGDWVIDNNIKTPFLITDTSNGKYDVVSIYGNDFVFSFNEVERFYHLWTIQDAKNGDVLADGNLPFIFKKIDTNKYSYAYCGISIDYGFRIESEGESGEWTWMQDIKPATKEQRDLLFQKMKEAGYEWDAEKKELKKISQEYPLTPDECIKPVWSEEDCNRISSIKYLLHELDNYNFDNWLESLKDRVQPKQEWSEEDESLRRRCIGAIDMANLSDYTKDSLLNWLKSLRPQNRWKPSDEQMDALHYVTNFDYGGYKVTLVSLYEQLKRLNRIKL